MANGFREYKPIEFGFKVPTSVFYEESDTDSFNKALQRREKERASELTLDKAEYDKDRRGRALKMSEELATALNEVDGDIDAWLPKAMEISSKHGDFGTTVDLAKEIRQRQPGPLDELNKELKEAQVEATKALTEKRRSSKGRGGKSSKTVKIWEDGRFLGLKTAEELETLLERAAREGKKITDYDPNKPRSGGFSMPSGGLEALEKFKNQLPSNARFKGIK
jgi:hypothetical protein